jgi:hypothetical protein
MDWSSVISGMEYPHWLMAAGGVMVVVGFVGLAFQKNAEPVEGREIAPTEDRSHLGPLPARPASPPPPFELDPRD